MKEPTRGAVVITGCAAAGPRVAACAQTPREARPKPLCAGAGQVTHTPAPQATPPGPTTAMQEIRNDLILDAAAQEAMAARLALVLAAALATLATAEEVC